jgi:hypothetical protein
MVPPIEKIVPLESSYGTFNIAAGTSDNPFRCADWS